MKTNKYIAFALALSFVVLFAYVATTTNLKFYQPYIAASAVLSTWLSFRTMTGRGNIVFMLLLALCWQFNVVLSWEAVLVGLTAVSAVTGTMVLLPMMAAAAKKIPLPKRNVVVKEYGTTQPHQAAQSFEAPPSYSPGFQATPDLSPGM